MKNHTHFVSLCRLFSLMILLSVAALQGQETTPETAAGFPRGIHYSGELKDGAGNALVGVQGVTLAIYSEQDGGAA